MATLGGAGVLGLEGQVGSIDSGKLADFQVLRPETAPEEKEIFDYFVSHGCTADIVQVYHQGKLKE
jgi:cytosine/adenosine deaminase-related metal-dependent hydrolase